MRDIEFSVLYGNERRKFSLPVRSTVVELKRKIGEIFNIPSSNQQLRGCLWGPGNDDQSLDTSVKIYELNKLKIIKEESQYIIEIYQYSSDVAECNARLCSTNRMNPEPSPVKDLSSEVNGEIESIRSLSRKWNITSIDLKHITLFDAVCSFSEAALSNRKPIFLYLHVSSVPSFLKSDGFLRIVENFTFIGWDIEKFIYHEDLIDALQFIPLPFDYELHLMESVIQKKTAAICFSPFQNAYSGGKVWCYTQQPTEYLCQQLETFIKKFQENIGNEIKEIEIESMRSLENKWRRKSISMRSIGIIEALSYKALPSDKKPLILYFHNSSHPFSEVFTNLLKDEDFLLIIRKFTFIGWDIENDAYHDALISMLRQTDLLDLSCFIERKQATAFCIMPLENELDVAFRLDLTEPKAVVREKLLNFLLENRADMENMEKNKQKNERVTPENLQQTFADLLCSRDYDRFEFDQQKYLKDKIGYALFGPPQNESGYSSKSNDFIKKIYKTIKKQSDAIAEFRDVIDISFIYNCIELCEKSDNNNSDSRSNVNPVPIFVLRKCRIKKNNQDQNKLPCRIFIDDNCRVYENWDDYLSNNKLPKCKMTLPLNGKYQFENDEVLLEKHLSPACDLGTVALNVADTAGTVAGVTSGGVFVAAAIPAIAVAPAALVGAAVVGGVVGAWGIGRSIYNLVDRDRHCESISLAESEARGAYFNIVAGAFGFVGAGANIAVSRLAASGVSIGKSAIYACNGINLLNIGMSGASIANSGYDIIYQWITTKEPPSALSLLQFSTSVLFFGHAVYSFRLTGTIIEESQARALKDYRDSLRSNRHRKTFDKLVKQTLRNNSNSMQGNSEVISTIRNILNKDETFASLTRNQKAMSKHGVKFSAVDGQIKLNGISVDMNEFMNFNRKQANIHLFEISQQNPAYTSSSRSAVASSSSVNFTETIQKFFSNQSNSSSVNMKNIIAVAHKIMGCLNTDVQTFLIKATNNVIDYCFPRFIQPMLPRFEVQNEYFHVLRIVISYFDDKAKEYENDYKNYQRTGDEKYNHFIFKLVNPVKARRFIQFFEHVVKNSFSESQFLQNELQELVKLIVIWVTQRANEETNEENDSAERRQHSAASRFSPLEIACSECGGFYYKH